MADTSKNGYTIIFLVITTVVAALILSVTSQSLKEKQIANKKFDQTKIVMRAMGFEVTSKSKATELNVMYDKYVERIFVTPTGKIVEVTDADKYNFEKAMKAGKVHAKAPADYASLPEEVKKMALPVYIRKDDSGKVVNYTVPVIGKGLWSTIYGYICLNASDISTVEGAIFYDSGETPGLGKEVEAEWFCNNFTDKKIFNDKGVFTSITVVKGSVNPADKNAIHKVDGVSGATITCVGVNALLRKDLLLYGPYFASLRSAK